jgi:hypothetical protein
MALSGRFAHPGRARRRPGRRGGHPGRGCRVAGPARLAGALARRRRARPRARGVRRDGWADPVAPRPVATRRDRHVGACGAAARIAHAARRRPRRLGAVRRRGRAEPDSPHHPVGRAAPDVRCSSPRAARPIDAPRRSRSARRGRSVLWSRQATLAAPDASACCRPFHSRAHLPSRLTRLRELDGARRCSSAVRARSSTRSASTWRGETCARSTGGDGATRGPRGAGQHAADGAHVASRA